MDRVFSVEEISDHLWSPQIHVPGGADESSKMSRSASEWAFQRFLQEAVTSPSSSSSVADDVIVDIDSQSKSTSIGAAPPPKDRAVLPNGNPHPPVAVAEDSDEFRAVLKSKLNLACAAVAMTRGSLPKSQDLATFPENRSQSSNPTQVRPQPIFEGSAPSGNDPPILQDKDVKSSPAIPSIPLIQKKAIVATRPSTSGSSREQSDYDEAEGETDMNDITDPADVKRVRRMLSNRESARRSRRRKQAHLTELETQVSQLKGENSSLVKHLSDVNQRYSEAAVDNRVLKADVETLRTKVKMAEERVKRITGLNPMFHTMPEISSMGLPSFDASPSDNSADAAVPVQEDPHHRFYQPAPNNPMPCHDLRVKNGLGDISSIENVQQSNAAVGGGSTASLNRVTSLEHLQKRIGGGVDSCGPSTGKL